MQKRVISVTGLGYVGLPVAVEFARVHQVIGFDINQKRVAELKNGHDRTREIGNAADLRNPNLYLTNDPEDLRKADFHIVAVPTPVNDAKQPDMGLVHKASATIGRALKKGDIVVYESTVYPGATEDECQPILEKESGLKGGVDFKIGFSPERINPGDHDHTFTKILKVVSGQDQESLDIIAEIFGSVVKAGIHKAESIKVAEAAKVIENAQRDINIAFMNELSLIFERMGIDTLHVLKAASTKWNFLQFFPGLVGGHCIGVDPFYLTHKAEKLGYHPEVILAGRRINDNMGIYVAQRAIELMVKKGIKILGSKVNLLGLTFKENCPDTRNTRVVDIYRELRRYGVNVDIYDPVAYAEDIVEEYGVPPVSFDKLTAADAAILAVPHVQLKYQVRDNLFRLMTAPYVFVDIKGSFDPSIISRTEGVYWRL
jgi:UDP-N-acetyl-D-glucosamine/UDP-N-acetyl-D-galactosamine dehydrogenase